MGNTSDHVQLIDQQEWEALARQFDDYNYQQTWAFGQRAAERLNADSENIAIRSGDDVIGIANVRIKSLPLLPMGIAYINGGPVILKSGPQIDTAIIFRRCLAALKREYVDRRRMVLRIICPIADEELIAEENNEFEKQGFKPSTSARFYRTMIIDVENDQESLRKNLAQKWRNCLNRAEKNDLKVLRGTGDELFEKFETLFNELRERKWFEVDMGVEYFRKLQRELSEDEKFIVHIAEADGKPVAGHIGSFIGGTAVYLLGASTDSGNKLKASYLLQWQVMMHAKESGCRYYDLGGIDPDGNPGVFRFKDRMGGVDLTAAGPFEAGTPVLGRLISSAEKLYLMFKG